jgi:hypothetical protein
MAHSERSHVHDYQEDDDVTSQISSEENEQAAREGSGEENEDNEGGKYVTQCATHRIHRCMKQRNE